LYRERLGVYLGAGTQTAAAVARLPSAPPRRRVGGRRALLVRHRREAHRGGVRVAVGYPPQAAAPQWEPHGAVRLHSCLDPVSAGREDAAPRELPVLGAQLGSSGSAPSSDRPRAALQWAWSMQA
jgi:hypothetical protein